MILLSCLMAHGSNTLNGQVYNLAQPCHASHSRQMDTTINSDPHIPATQGHPLAVRCQQMEPADSCCNSKHSKAHEMQLDRQAWALCPIIISRANACSMKQAKANDTLNTSLVLTYRRLSCKHQHSLLLNTRESWHKDLSILQPAAKGRTTVQLHT
jgi:hypothetical protein